MQKVVSFILAALLLFAFAPILKVHADDNDNDTDTDSISSTTIDNSVLSFGNINNDAVELIAIPPSPPLNGTHDDDDDDDNDIKNTNDDSTLPSPSVVLMDLTQSTTTQNSATTVKDPVTTTRQARVVETPKGNANELVDHMLDQWRKQIKKDGFDPLFIPRIDQKMVVCWNCVIMGLSNLQRTGDVTLFVNDTGLALEADIGVEELKAQCLCEARVLMFAVNGKINLHIVGFSAVGRIEQVNKEGAKAQLTSLNVKQPGHFGTFFQGNGILGKLAEWFGQNIIKNTIQKELLNSNRLKQMANEGLQKINIFQQLQSGFTLR